MLVSPRFLEFVHGKIEDFARLAPLSAGVASMPRLLVIQLPKWATHFVYDSTSVIGGHVA